MRVPVDRGERRPTVGSLRRVAALKAETKALEGPLPGGGEAGVTVRVEPLLGGSVLGPPGFFESRGGRLATLRMLGIGTPKSRWWVREPDAYPMRHRPSFTPLACRRTARRDRMKVSSSKPLGTTWVTFPIRRSGAASSGVVQMHASAVSAHRRTSEYIVRTASSVSPWVRMPSMVSSVAMSGSTIRSSTSNTTRAPACQARRTMW